MLAEFEVDVFCICETWLTDVHFLNIPGYHILRKDRSEPYGGVLIGVRRGIEFHSLPVPNAGSIEVVACSIKMRDFTCSILSVYIPPNCPFSAEPLRQILNSVPEPCMILGDFNAHGMAWGSCRDDGRSKIIMEILDDFRFSILNDGSYTRINHINNPSCLDLSLCTSSIALNCSWKTVNDPFGSDHLPIVINYSKSGQILQDRCVMFDLTKHVNWRSFSIKVSKVVDGIQDGSNLKQNYSIFARGVVDALCSSQTKSIPTVQQGKRTPTIWWDDECTDALQAKSKMFKQFRRTGSQKDYIDYKRLEALFVRITKKKKRGYWRSFVESLDKDTALTTLWSTARKLRNSSYSSTPVDNYSEEWMTRFAKKICPDFVSTDNVYLDVDNSQHSMNNIASPFTIEEFEFALESSKNSCPGLDGIKFNVLAKLPEEAKLFLLSLFNNFIIENVCPDEWREVKVIGILKPSKDPSSEDSYRPICLLPCPRKLLEKMILNRLEPLIEKSGVLSKTQYGFRRGRGTRDCLALLATNVQIAFNRKEELAAVFLDVAGAYDSVIIDKLCSKLYSIGVPTFLSNFLLNLLSKKKMTFYLNNVAKISRDSYFGLPQGSCLSPFLFNIYTNDMDNCIADECYLIQYADDSVIWVAGKDRIVMQTSLQQSINNLVIWGDSHGFSYSNEKTELMVFSRKRSPANLKVFLYGSEVKLVHETKYLGIWYDPKMTWKTHINYLLKKCQKRVNFLRTITGTWWGAHPKLLLTLYNTTILSVLEYGSFVFDQAAKTHMLKLCRLQNRCIRISLGLMQSTHIQSLEVLAGIPPLSLRFFELSCRFVIQSFGASNDVERVLDKLFEINPQVKYSRHTDM